MNDTEEEDFHSAPNSPIADDTERNSPQGGILWSDTAQCHFDKYTASASREVRPQRPVANTRAQVVGPAVRARPFGIEGRTTPRSDASSVQSDCSGTRSRSHSPVVRARIDEELARIQRLRDEESKVRLSKADVSKAEFKSEMKKNRVPLPYLACVCR